MQGQAWVELVGDLLIARVRGEPTELDQTLGPTRLRSAIVVPNSRLAYLARLAGEPAEPR